MSDINVRRDELIKKAADGLLESISYAPDKNRSVSDISINRGEHLIKVRLFASGDSYEIKFDLLKGITVVEKIVHIPAREEREIVMLLN